MTEITRYEPDDEMRVRRLLGSGLRAYEVADIIGVTLASLSAFMKRKNIVLMAALGTPPPDLTHPEKTIVYTKRVDPVSGAPRIKRASLPAITMHRRALAEKWSTSL